MDGLGDVLKVLLIKNLHILGKNAIKISSKGNMCARVFTCMSNEGV